MARPPPAGPAASPSMSTSELVVEGAGSKNEAFGTRTLAELRNEAIKERRDVLVSLMPARGAMLAELFYLLRDKDDPGRFGAGLDPSPSMSNPSKGPVHDESTDMELAKFTERWIRDPRLASHIPFQLAEIEPDTLPSQLRRDSTNVEMSEEVAALERELIQPEYRGQDPSTAAPNSISKSLEDTTTILKGSIISSAVPQDALPKDDTSAGRHRRLPSSTVSPYPVTFRSPAFLSSLTEPSAPPILSEPPSIPPLTIDPSQLTLQVPDEQAQSISSTNLASRFPASEPCDYVASLPPIPDFLVKGRLAVGGLAKKKARERAAAQPNSQSVSSLGPTNSDLYKLGVSKATHSSLRSLIGAGAPQAGKARTGGKILLTDDWHVAIQEMQTLKALERIEQLKADKSWSLRQLRKQRAPGTQKAHWDYLLEEMRWMAIDFRQETRWKVAAAAQASKDVMDWHRAGSDDEKKKLQVMTKEPDFLSLAGTEVATHDIDTVLETPENSGSMASAGTQIDLNRMDIDGSHINVENDKIKDSEIGDSMKLKADRLSKAAALGPDSPGNTISSIPPSSSFAGSIATEVPRQKRHQHGLMRTRAPVFDCLPSSTVYDLSKSQHRLPEDYKAASSYDVVNELFQELPLYGPPIEPSNDPRQNRRIDEASPTYARITNPSHLLESKPLLVSTLYPSRKRKRSGGWNDLLELTGDDNKDLMGETFGTTQDIVPGVMKSRDTGNKRFNPAPPPNAEARSASFDWTVEDDRQLYTFVRQYSYNWDLVAHVFNGATKRPKTDERLPWDCFDRWNKKFVQPSQQPLPQSGSSQIVQSAQGQAAQNQNPNSGSPAQIQPPHMQINPNKKDRRASTSGNHPSSAGLTPSSIATPKKADISKAQIRHNCMVEATRKVQRRREGLQKNNIPPAVRKVNLNAHETHNQPFHPNLSALDLSKLKAERERAQLEELRKREQQKMYQQAQAAAMAQQQQQQQMQAQAQVQQRSIQVPPNVRLPPGAVAASIPSNQAALLQAQRNIQMPPHIQTQQQNQPRPMPQHTPRLSSQAGIQQPVMMPGPGQMLQQQGNGSSPPMQNPNLPPGVHVSMQQRTESPLHQASQSPQSSHIQLSPHQIQMQLQQVNSQLPQMSPAQQAAFMAQLVQAQGRSASPSINNQSVPQIPGGFPAQQGRSPEQQQLQQQQQQQLFALMRMRQNSQGSQGSVQ